MARVGSRSPAAEAVSQLLLWGHPAAWLPTPIMGALLELVCCEPEGDQAELVQGAYQLLSAVTKVSSGDGVEHRWIVNRCSLSVAVQLHDGFASGMCVVWADDASKAKCLGVFPQASQGPVHCFPCMTCPCYSCLMC